MSEENALKVILLGEMMVGKTNLINRLMGDEFNENESATSTSSFCLKDLTIKGNKYTIQVWDTIGQEKLRQLTKMFYTNSKIVIFVYDITNKESFEEIKNYWVNDVEEKLGKNVIKGIVGNKIDLFLNEQISQIEVEEYAKSINAEFIVTSAKTDNPEKFENFLAVLYGKYLNKNGTSSPTSNSNEQKNNTSIILRKKKSVRINKGKKCCEN